MWFEIKTISCNKFHIKCAEFVQNLQKGSTVISKIIFSNKISQISTQKLSNLIKHIIKISQVLFQKLSSFLRRSVLGILQNYLINLKKAYGIFNCKKFFASSFIPLQKTITSGVAEELKIFISTTFHRQFSISFFFFLLLLSARTIE